MLLSAPLAAGEPRLPPPFPPLFAPPIGCLMSAGRDALKPPPPPPAAAESGSLYPSYHAGVAAGSPLLHLGYPPSSHAVYQSFPYPAFPAAARPPLPAAAAEPRPLYPLSFRPAPGKEPVVAPPAPAASRAAPPSFRPLQEEVRGFGGAGGKDGVLRVPAHYPAHVGGVFPPPPPPATAADVSRAAYPAAGTPPRSAAPAQPAAPVAGYQYSGRRVHSAEESPRPRMLAAEAANEHPPPAKRARLEAARERSAAPAPAPASGRVKTEMPSAVNNDQHVPSEHFRCGSIIELADGE